MACLRLARSAGSSSLVSFATAKTLTSNVRRPDGRGRVGKRVETSDKFGGSNREAAMQLRGGQETTGTSGMGQGRRGKVHRTFQRGPCRQPALVPVKERGEQRIASTHRADHPLHGYCRDMLYLRFSAQRHHRPARATADDRDLAAGAAAHQL